jgi:hypothetical protein
MNLTGHDQLDLHHYCTSLPMMVMLLSNVSVTVITQNLSCLDVTEWDLLFFCPGDKQLAIRMACVLSMEHMINGDEFVLPPPKSCNM